MAAVRQLRACVKKLEEEEENRDAQFAESSSTQLSPPGQCPEHAAFMEGAPRGTDGPNRSWDFCIEGGIREMIQREKIDHHGPMIKEHQRN